MGDLESCAHLVQVCPPSSPLPLSLSPINFPAEPIKRLRLVACTVSFVFSSEEQLGKPYQLSSYFFPHGPSHAFWYGERGQMDSDSPYSDRNADYICLEFLVRVQYPEQNRFSARLCSSVVDLSHADLPVPFVPRNLEFRIPSPSDLAHCNSLRK